MVRVSGAGVLRDTMVPPPSSAWVIPVLAGGGAGLIETVLTYPLDLIKTRQQVTTSPLSVGRTLTAVARGNGVLGFYRGLSAPVLSEVPRRAFKFGFNARLQRLLKDLGVVGLPVGSCVCLRLCEGVGTCVSAF